MKNIEYSFNAFCKVVLRNEAINIYRELNRKCRLEVSFENFFFEKYFVSSTTDKYFRDEYEPTVFTVQENTIIIIDKCLATAISKLSKQYRLILLMYFFLKYTDKKIGTKFGLSKSTANRRRHTAMRQLRKEMNKLRYEKKKFDTF